ncbi:ANR family transcriptional regulator [Lelliottia sp. SL45]|uniref:ANR family transcriptional regulator n=1 Tax=Lelliottia sp. SL45 TaxID=2994665 RepID=UPI002276C5D2|nr:ANR family transcriptional regulator [Lelliottia sp. SL45]MCY1700973.1 ANR family transcriptional regulator [Lelliottia sp. SL45]
MKPYSEFSHLAERAVKTEQMGNYADAARFWHDASMAARVRANLEWAQARKAYCEQRCVRGYNFKQSEQ